MRRKVAKESRRGRPRRLPTQPQFASFTARLRC
jgi:hypothetical protein